jgi:hypothetical protein
MRSTAEGPGSRTWRRTQGWVAAFLLVMAGLPATGEAQSPADTASAEVIRGWSFTFLIGNPRDQWSAPATELLVREEFDSTSCSDWGSMRCTRYPWVQRPGTVRMFELRRVVTRRFDAGISASSTPMVEVAGRGHPTHLTGGSLDFVAYKHPTLTRHVRTIAPIASIRLDPLHLHAGPAVHRIRSTVSDGRDSSSERLNRFGYVLGTGFVMTTGRGWTLEARAQYREIPGKVAFPAHTWETGVDWDPVTESYARLETYTLPSEPVRLSHWVLGFGTGLRPGRGR